MSASTPVVVSSSSPSWGGLEIQTIVSAVELSRRGYPVCFLARKGTRVAKEAEREGLDVEAVLPSGYFSPIALLRVASIFKKRRIRIAHAEYSRDLWTLVPASRLAGGVRIFFTQGMASGVDKKDPLHRWLYGRTEKVLAISNAIVKNLKKRYPLAPEQIVLVHRGIDLDEYTHDPPARRAIRKELDLPLHAPVAGLVGRISQGKGHFTYLRACAIVARKVPDAQFLLIGSVTRGEEEYNRRLRALAEEIALGERLLFTGFRSDIPKLLSAIDLLVVPSQSESLGNTAIEGLAASLPVVAAGSAGLLDIVEDGVCGSLFPPGDPEALADAMITLLRDPGLRGKMGAAARHRAEEKFDRRRRTDTIEKLYAQSLK